MHEEDVRLPNEKPHAYHFSITHNGCEFRLLTSFAIVALLKDDVSLCMVSFA